MISFEDLIGQEALTATNLKAPRIPAEGQIVADAVEETPAITFIGTVNEELAET